VQWLRCTSSGESRFERQYRGDETPRLAGKKGEQPEKMTTYRLLAGIDWATQEHQVCVIDPEQRVVAERVVEHTGSGIAEFLDWLSELGGGEPATVAVAIEVPRGALVESLYERGFAAFTINPKQLDRFRDRHTVAGAKDDRRDAFVLADSLRTDQKLFRRVRIDDPLVIELREISRAEEELKEENNRLSNRLREQMLRYFPQVLRLSSSMDEPWIWNLLQLAPTPDKARKLQARQVERVLRAHRIRRLKTKQVLDELRTPPLRLAPGAVQAASAHVLLLLPRLRLVHGQQAECAKRIDSILQKLQPDDSPEGKPREHRDVDIILSLPGIGRVTAATMLAEAPQAVAERDYHALRSLSGVAPVTRSSAKSRVVVMRRACNARLREALYHASRVHSQVDPHSRALYTDQRRRGHSHGRALRSVADRMLRILVAMLESDTLYDANLPRRVPAGASSTEKAA